MNAVPVMAMPGQGSALAPPLLELRRVEVAASEHAPPVLHGISFDVRRGEVIAIVGPSGSGKTSLLRTIAGTIAPRTGTVKLEGFAVAELRRDRNRALRARVGMITQKHDLVDMLRVDKNVMAGALGRWSSIRALRFLLWSTRDELAQAEAALAAVGLADKLKRPTSTLSGGEQQRVAIARALVQAPAVLLADEPVASLDPASAVQVMGLLADLARSRGTALIASLHQPELAKRFCDRIIELRDGRMGFPDNAVADRSVCGK